jgi:membrane protein
LPASLYGEGLRRAFNRLSNDDDSAASVAWRGRARALASFALTPLMLLVVVLAATQITSLRMHGFLGNLFALGGTFVVGSAVCAVGVAFAYRLVAPERPRLPALLRGSALVGALIAGELVTYVLYLGLPAASSAGKAYGGMQSVGAIAVALGWLYALHLVLLIGYVVVLRLDDAGGTLTKAADRRHTRRSAQGERIPEHASR